VNLSANAHAVVVAGGGPAGMMLAAEPGRARASRCQTSRNEMTGISTKPAS
jgi:predicted flavoprotein YhiN